MRYVDSVIAREPAVDVPIPGGDAEALRMKSDIWPHVFFGVFITLPVTFMAVDTVLTEGPGQWVAAFVCLALAALWHLYYDGLLLTVSDGVLTYRTVFRTRSLPLASVTCSDVVRRNGGYGRYRDRRIMMTIWYGQGDILEFNLKPFHRGDIRRLLALPELKLSPTSLTF